jgi:hypothetical protein
MGEIAENLRSSPFNNYPPPMTTLSARSMRQICASAVGYRIDVLFKDICTDGIKLSNSAQQQTLKIHNLTKRFHMCHEQGLKFSYYRYCFL